MCFFPADVNSSSSKLSQEKLSCTPRLSLGLPRPYVWLLTLLHSVFFVSYTVVNAESQRLRHMLRLLAPSCDLRHIVFLKIPLKSIGSSFSHYENGHLMGTQLASQLRGPKLQHRPSVGLQVFFSNLHASDASDLGLCGNL